MRTPWMVSRGRIGTGTSVLGTLTASLLIGAAVLRQLAEDRRPAAPPHLAGTGAPPPPIGSGFLLENLASAAAGAGVLLLAITLVVAVREHPSRGFAVAVGVGTLCVAVAAAVAAGLAVVAAPTPGAMFDLLTVRTALAAIAAACLPAVAIAASDPRQHRVRSHHH